MTIYKFWLIGHTIPHSGMLLILKRGNFQLVHDGNFTEIDFLWGMILNDLLVMMALNLIIVFTSPPLASFAPL